jgi:hypothetical protein
MLKRSGSVCLIAGFMCMIMFGCSSPTKTPAPLQAPILRIPQDSAAFQSDTLTLIWNPSEEATEYCVQASTIDNFSSLTVNATVTTSSYNITTPLLNNTAYYWRVSASLNGKRTSDWSNTFLFTTGVPAPVLTNPMNGNILTPDTLTLTWNASTGATINYYVQLSTDITFSTTFIINDSTASPLYAITSPLSANEVTYYWRVRDSTYQGLSAWSPTDSFQTWLMPAPTLLTPADGASGVSLTDSLIWNKPAGWLVSSYHVQVSTASDFSSNVVVDNSGVSAMASGVPDTTYFFSLATSSLSSGTYYWRVASIDFLTHQSAWWSTVWSFTIP